jgi:hypothetical protein
VPLSERRRGAGGLTLSPRGGTRNPIAPGAASGELQPERRRHPSRSKGPGRWYCGPVRTQSAAATLALILVLATHQTSPAQAGPEAPETERLYLSGPDADAPRTWGFRISGGRRAGEWAEIPVPSQWQQHGFGRYAYGHDERTSADVGTYRTEVVIPDAWRDRRVRLVFEGAMTDTTPTWNGTRLRTHRGGFTPFSYDVTRLVRFGSANALEVRVAERSGNATVNAAERKADYWVFGGIYRPVYLEAVPRAAIEDLALDARHDGSLSVSFFTRHAPAGSRVRSRVLAESGVALRSGVDSRLEAQVTLDGRAAMQATFAGVLPWSAETPHLYVLEATLEDGTGAPLHHSRQRFGFRTIEVRLEGRGPVGRESLPGLYVNDQRVLLRGVNRHSFWPDTGRAGSPARNLADVEKLKSLNLNAVRTSHYPPDRDFLDACDELGIYVIDELPGWHDAYDAVAGAAILRAMLRRDRNHPSVILWANGNEGGWNRRLDARFADQDPQGRPVLHPDEDFGGFDTKHYPTFADLRARLAEPGPRGTRSLVLPTEWLHGLYDGGGGAGLGAYWEAMRVSRRGAGGFLWSFTDEAIARTDRDGALDHHGNFAPDGILGPWREQTGSSVAVREIFAPVRLLAVVTEEGAPISDAAGHHHAHPMASESRLSSAAAAGPGRGREMLDHSSATESRRPAVLLQIENRTETLDLDAFTFTWRQSRLSGPLAVEEPSPRVLASGMIEGPPTRPGGRAWLAVETDTTSPHATARADDTLALDVLEIQVAESAARGGREIARWVLPLGSDLARASDALPESAGDSGDLEDLEGSAIAPRDGFLELRAGGTAARFDAARGTLSSLERDGIVLPLHGVVAVGDESSAASGVAARRAASGDVLDVTWTAPGALREARWRVDTSGWLHLRYRLEDSAAAAAGGIAFTGLGLEELRRLEWTGGGPFRVWGNRLDGVNLGRWILQAGQDEPLSWVSNELAGARSEVRWLSIELETGRLIVVPKPRTHPDEGLRAPTSQAARGAPFVWLSTPTFPEGSRGAVAELTGVLADADTLAVLHRLPSIGTKFHAAAEISPAAPIADEVVEGEVALLWQPIEPDPSSPVSVTP